MDSNVVNTIALENLDGFRPVSLDFASDRPSVCWQQSDGTELVTDLDRFYPNGIGEGNESGTLRVNWADTLDVPIHGSFYDQQIRKANESLTVGRRLQTSWDDVMRIAHLCPPVKFSGMVFHTARGGSTLLHRMLNQIPSNISFCEPSVINSLINNSKDWSGNDRALGVLALLRILARCKPLPTVPRAFVKFNDTIAMDIDLLRTILPDVPCLFIYRDPLEVLVSITRKQTGTLGGLDTNRAYWSEHLGIPELAQEDMPMIEAAARIIGRIFESVANSAEADGVRAPLLVIDYHSLPDAFIDKVAPFFGLSLSAEDIANLAPETGRYSKSDEERAFVPDREEKQRAATPNMKRLVEQFVAPAAERCRLLCV